MSPSLDASRSTDREVARLLEAPVRRRIVDMVSNTPGLAVGEILASLDVGWGTLHHHLRKLEQRGLIHTRQVGRRRLVFPGRAPLSDTPLLSVLTGPASRRVAQAVLDHPGLGMAELLARLEDSPRAVYYHVKRLVDAGLVLSERPTRYTRLHPSPNLAGALRVRD